MSDTFDPIKLALVHVRLDDGDDRLDLKLELDVGVEELLVEDAVHVDAIEDGCSWSGCTCRC